MSLIWSVPKSNLKVFLSPLNQLGLIPCALVGFPEALPYLSGSTVIAFPYYLI